ncbi:hypothetical protein GOL49_29505 [Sinorhizobium medicae]|nr:hypothetical protein [Sinorhizobium medicae]
MSWLGGPRIDKAVAAELLRVVQPMAIEAMQAEHIQWRARCFSLAGFKARSLAAARVLVTSATHPCSLKKYDLRPVVTSRWSQPVLIPRY